MDNRALLFTVVLVLLSGSGGALLTDSFRPGGESMMRQQLRLDLELMEFRIRRDMPPDHTRARIEALEEALRAMDPAYRRPTSKWSDPDWSQAPR